MSEPDTPTASAPACAREPLSWEPVFLETLQATGNVSGSARAAGIDRTTAYEHRGRHPDFASRWEAAVEEATDGLETEARRRAVEGVEKPVYQGGELVGTVQEYSDTLLLALLKAHRPDKFRDKFQGAIQVGGLPGAPPVKVEGKDADPAVFAAEVAAILAEAGVIPALSGGDDPQADEVHPAGADT